MDDRFKPVIITALLVLASISLFWFAAPDLSPVWNQAYAEFVLLFTLVVSVSSLYFIYGILSEVLTE